MSEIITCVLENMVFLKFPNERREPRIYFTALDKRVTVPSHSSVPQARLLSQGALSTQQLKMERTDFCGWPTEYIFNASLKIVFKEIKIFNH